METLLSESMDFCLAWRGGRLVGVGGCRCPGLFLSKGGRLRPGLLPDDNFLQRPEHMEINNRNKYLPVPVLVPYGKYLGTGTVQGKER